MMVTMLPKVVVFLACLCVVKAGVLTVNAYEDQYDGIESVYDGADTLDRTVRNCVNSQCNSICRALGFAGGVCVSPTVCRCSGRAARDAPLEEVNQEINQDPEEVVVRTTRGCGAAECNAFCRKMGYARGVCIGTYCQCRLCLASDVSQPEIENPSSDNDPRSAFLDAIRPAEDTSSDEATLESSVRRCVNSQCQSACRRRGFARGVCIGINICRCSGRLIKATEENDDVDQEIENGFDGADTLDRSLRNCVNSQCNSICRALGFAQGVCISSTVCRCSGRRSVDISNEEATHNDIYQDITNVNDDAETLDRSVRNCINSQCNSLCRALGFARGVCISPTVCRCSGRRSADISNAEATHDDIYQDITNVNDDAETLDRSVRNCINSQCNSLCRALGFARGVCISPTVCRCSGRRSADISNAEATHDDIYQDITNVNDDAETLDRSVRNCINSQCNSLCRALGFAQGVCISPTVCRCSGRRSADKSNEKATHEDVYQGIDITNVNDDAETLDRSVRNCVNSQCNSLCRALGFAQGVCISPTVCRCSGRRNADISNKEATHDDIYQDITNLNDDAETLDRSVRNCINSQCNSLCRALGFAQGVCISPTVCRCSGRRSADKSNEKATHEDVYQGIDITNVNDDAETLDRSVRNCVNSQCNSLCRALGFAQGVCISPTVCRCSGRRNADISNKEATHDDIYQDITNVNDDAKTLDRSVRNCINSQCNSLCRALGFARGVCISPTVCRCSGRRSADTSNAEATHDDIYQDITNLNDDAETLDRSVRNCINSQCNSLCRALGFAQGVCISPTVCRCSGRRSADISNAEATHDDIYQDITNVNDDAETLDRSVRNCINSQCNSLCRALGFARGVCISPTVCRCSGRRSADTSNAEATHDDIYQDITNLNDDAETLDRSVRNCINSQCNSLCRALGFAQGVCISPTVCRCSGRRSADISNAEATHDDIYQDITNVNDDAETLDRSVRNCINSQCNSLCRALGFARGVCISPTVCRCSGRRSADTSNAEATHDDIYQDITNVNDDAETIDRSVRNCINSQCNSLCRALGFARGVCISPTVCRCSGRRSADISNAEATHDDIYQEKANVNDGADTLDRSVRNCVNSQCNSICRALGFAQGVCISPTVCRCSGRLPRDASLEANIIKDETPAINEVADKKADCNLRWCEQTCRRMGFPGGACVNGRCKCDLLRSPQPDNDVAANETDNGDVKPAVEEESNDIPQN